MANPAEFCKASADPTDSGGQLLEAMAENCGESATTAAPQTMRNASNPNGEACDETHGKRKQQKPEIINAAAATRALPKRFVNEPPRRHPMDPAAIIAKESAEELAQAARVKVVVA